MHDTLYDRRKALAVVAAAPAAVVLGTGAAFAVGFPVRLTATMGEAGRLSALMVRLQAEEKRWRDECDDNLSDALYEKIVTPTMGAIIGVPARTPEDALAAIDYLIREQLIEEGAKDFGAMVDSLVEAIRGYIVSTKT